MSDAAKKPIEQPGVAVGQAGGQEYTFRFVEVGEPSRDRDEDARSIIRSHVMRDFYDKRDRRRKPSTRPLPNPAAPKNAGPPQTQRFKVGPQGLQEVKKRRKKGSSVHGELPPLTTGSGATIETAAISHAYTPTLFKPASAQYTAKSIPRKTAPYPRNIGRSAAQLSLSPQSGYVVLQPEAHLVDPFNTLPPSNSPQTQRLLYYGM